jgi:hypothetical protein
VVELTWLLSLELQPPYPQLPLPQRFLLSVHYLLMLQQLVHHLPYLHKT